METKQPKVGVAYKVEHLYCGASKNRHHHVVTNKQGQKYYLGENPRRMFLGLSDDPSTLAGHVSRNGVFGTAIQCGTLYWKLVDPVANQGVFIIGDSQYDEGEAPTKSKRFDVGGPVM